MYIIQFLNIILYITHCIKVDDFKDRTIHICFKLFVKEPDDIYSTFSQYLSHLIISL